MIIALWFVFPCVCVRTNTQELALGDASITDSTFKDLI